MKLDVICLEDRALKELFEMMYQRLMADHGVKEDKWLSPEEAMRRLNVGKTTLQKYRDENKLRFSELSARKFVYDAESVAALLDAKAQKKY